MPVSGPSSAAINAGEPLEPGGLPFGLVKLTPDTVGILHQFEPRGLAGSFTDKRPPASLNFGVGDTLTVTIFEAAAGGLFIPSEAGVRPGNYVTLPEQAIDNNGNITVPYAGEIKAAGRTAVQVQNDIVARIRNRAIEPQVVVNVVNQRTSLISVLGDVNTPSRFGASASGAGDRILDAITRAGGIKNPGYSTWVMLERKGKHATVPFENLVMNSSNNIYVQPGDRIYVYTEQQKFVALGATGQSGEFNFDAWRINLAEAVGKAGGLLDAQADPDAVFLYRAEPRDVAERLGVDLGKFPGAATIPVIFSINLRDPGGFFLATKTQMRNGDIIFVSNARSVEVSKVLQYIRVILATTSDVATTANNGIALRNNIKNLRNN
ncbi:MAG: polysaccharide export protein [Rhodopseudomonas sp.]|nr:polysaccharide export protein [Rhodopseudomonas sp.]